MMELHEKFKSYQSKVRNLEGNEKSGDSFREIHLATENIFDEIKSHKSARDFKWLFLLLLSLVIIASALHMAKYGVGFNLIPIFALIGFWIYYRYTLKIAITKQLERNKKIPDESTGSKGNKEKLSNRIQYILNGIEVLETRIMLIRNQYSLFFPLFTILVVDLIRGPLDLGSFISTSVISIILGGSFWIFYFRNDLIDLENAEEELEILQQNLTQL